MLAWWTISWCEVRNQLRTEPEGKSTQSKKTNKQTTQKIRLSFLEAKQRLPKSKNRCIYIHVLHEPLISETSYAQ